MAEFLQLRPGRVSELEQLLQARQAALVPLFQTALQQLGILLNTDGNPAQFGILVIQIHALQQQMGQVQQSFLSHFVAILDTDQLQNFRPCKSPRSCNRFFRRFSQFFSSDSNGPLVARCGAAGPPTAGRRHVVGFRTMRTVMGMGVLFF